MNKKNDFKKIFFIYNNNIIMEENKINEEELIIETKIRKRKPKQVGVNSTPCRHCGGIKQRLGWYCDTCNVIKTAERRRKSGLKPNYKRTNCKGCGGIRDRETEKSKGYFCNECLIKRKNFRKEVKNEMKNELKNKFMEKISNTISIKN